MSTTASLLDRAKSRLLTAKEVAGVAAALKAGEGGDAYTAVHILGLMNATEHETLVARFLEDQKDPLVARMALQVLCAHWGLSARYKDKIVEFARGVSWDTDEDIRLAALSAAGELSRETEDAGIVRLLLQIFISSTERHLIRQAAYFGLARAAGRDWSQMPPASRRLDLNSEVDPSVIAWANEHSRL